MLGNEELVEVIEQEFNEAKKKLSSNSVSETQELREKLDSIWSCIKQQGFAEETGISSALYPAYTIMQGIIENAAESRSWNIDDPISAFILAPHMPMPLMFSKGGELEEINLSILQAPELYRNTTLTGLLNGGAVVHAVYAHNAKTALSNQEGFNNYVAYLERHEKLHDHPVITIDMANFPTNIAGAMYFIDKVPVVVESCQIDDTKPSTWAIRIGDCARTRVVEIKQFFEENGASNLNL